MMPSKYAVKFRGVEGQIVLTYDDKSRLEKIDISEIYEHDEHRLWIWEWIPKTTTALLSQRLKATAQIQITAIEQDLSFERFWDEYDYKVGKKKRAETLWKQLPDTDKSKVFDAIKRYKYFLAHKPNLEMTYPETFLSQERYNNDFKIKK